MCKAEVAFFVARALINVSWINIIEILKAMGVYT